MSNVNISPELEKQIGEAAYANSFDGKKHSKEYFQGYAAGATAYAQKYEQAIRLYEGCFKGAMRSSRAFTEPEMESHWNGVKAKYNL